MLIQRAPWRAGGHPLTSWHSAPAKSANSPLHRQQETYAPVPRTLPSTSEKPWGSIEVTRIPLEESREVFLDHSSWLHKPKWVFANVSKRQLTEFFGSCELREREKDELLDASKWQEEDGGCSVFPSEDLILHLGAGSRRKIYALLSRTEANYPQNHPFRFSLDGFNDRFIGAGIPAEKLAFIRSLTYTNQDLLAFADLEPVAKILSLKEFRSMINALYSIPSVKIRLRVASDSNIDSLLHYWGVGGREDRLRPILESLARIEGGESINVSYFMPAFPRLHLYTFPDPQVEPRTDCFYTALNFFNETPDARFSDPIIVKKTLQTGYSRAQGDPHFGDLIILADQAGDALHVAVFIADDIVFTKNGASYLQPWVMMRISDMLAYYPTEKPWNIVVLRKTTTG